LSGAVPSSAAKSRRMDVQAMSPPDAGGAARGTGRFWSVTCTAERFPGTPKLASASCCSVCGPRVCQ